MISRGNLQCQLAENSEVFLCNFTYFLRLDQQFLLSMYWPTNALNKIQIIKDNKW